MKVLGLDTATSACSAAVYGDGKVMSRRFEAMTRGQSEALMPMVEQVLDEAKTDALDLDLIVVTVGPGAFTGLRIGIACARGLSLASGVEAIGISTSQAIAFEAGSGTGNDQALLVALDSKRDDIYIQAFKPKGDLAGFANAYAPVEAIAPDKLVSRLNEFNIPGRISIVGDATLRAEEILRDGGVSAEIIDAPGMPDAAQIATYAARHWGSRDKFLGLTPVYLRPPDAAIPRDGGRLRA